MDCSWTMTFDDEGIPQIERISISMDDSSYTTAISLEFQQQAKQQQPKEAEVPAWSNEDDEEEEEEEYRDEYFLEDEVEDRYYGVASREEHHDDDDSDEDFQDSQQQQEQHNGGGSDFYQRYEVGELLGSGGYGDVYRCKLKGSSSSQQRPCAVKIVNIENYDPDEIQLLQELIDCPNVTGVVELFSNETMVYIVMPEMRGGDLLDRMQSMGGSYEEPDAKALIQTLLETVQYCHSKGIVHMDIKPDNILLRSPDDPTDMELADFGLAQRFIDHQGNNRIRLTHRIGTIDYWAPEIILQPQDPDDEDFGLVGYDERVDVWSIGVVLYVLLSGYLPFVGHTEDDILQQVCSGCFEFHEPYWNNVSQEAKDLITMMLQVNPDERCSVDEALESPWFQETSTCPRFGTC